MSMSFKSRLFLTMWLITSASIGSPTPCTANTAVVLKPTVSISRSTVKLSDLFEGVPTAIDREIAMAPAPCKPAIYDEAVLNRLADTYRLDWNPIDGVDHSIVTSACSRISSEMIRDKIVNLLKQDNDTKGRTFEIALDGHIPEIDLPADQLPDFTLENFAYDAMNKRFHADLSAQLPHGPYSVSISGHVDVKRSVPVLAHRLESGTTISASDLDWMQVPEERLSADIITEPSQLIGRELRRDKVEDEVMRSHDVAPARMIIRNSLITMQIDTPFMTVTAQGKAQQDGAIGDTVRALNTQSNRIVEGVVTGPGTISINTVRHYASAE